MTKYPRHQLFLGLLFGVASITSGFAAEPAGAVDTKMDTSISRSVLSPSSKLPPTSSWNASVVGQGQSNAGQWSDSLVSFRVYDDFSAGRPIFGRRQPAYSVDVNAQFETCADGNIRISTLDIGGLLYQPADSCEHSNWRRNVIGIRDGNPSNAAKRAKVEEVPDASSEQIPNEQATDDNIIRCDPASWSCQTVGR